MVRNHVVAASRDDNAAALLRGHRLRAGLTQTELAQRAGVSLGAVRDAEQGRTGRPRRRSLILLAEALGLGEEDTERLVRTASEPDRTPRGGGAVPPPSGVPPRRAGLWLGVLGPLEAWRDGNRIALGERRLRVTLGVLALAPNTPVHRDELVDALWGDTPPGTAASLMQDYIGALRRKLDPDRTPNDPGGRLTSADGYATLRVTARELDLLAFEELIGDQRNPQDDPSDASADCRRYEQALRLWRGRPSADWPGAFVHPRVAALDRARAAAVYAYSDAAFRLGLHQDVLPHLEELARHDPLDERAHGRLMTALAGVGQQARALEVFDGIRRRLDEQLGIRPGSELAEAHVKVLRQEVPLARRGAGRPAVEPVPRQLPNVTRHFSGRVDELKGLTEMLDRAVTDPDQGTVPVLVVDGMAGVGKTSLAVRWAHNIADRYPDGQLYADLRGFHPSGAPGATAAEVIRRFFDALSVPPERVPGDGEAQIALYRSLLADRRVLIVLDNAAGADQVRPILPASPSCAVLVTSRRKLTGLVVHEGAQTVSLPQFRDWEARELLARFLGPDRLAAEPEAVADLIGLCAGLPLALSIAVTRANQFTPASLGTLVEELREASNVLDALSTGDADSDLRAVISWSYHKLSAAAARLFRLLGEHPGPDISAAAATSLAGCPAAEGRALLRELAVTGLAEERSPGRYALHDLLRAYARDEAAALGDGERREAVRRVLDHYLWTAAAADDRLMPTRGKIDLGERRPDAGPEPITDVDHALSWFDAEHEVLLAAVRWADASGFDVHVWQLAWALATVLSQRGHWAALSEVQHLALAASRRLGDPDGQARALRSLGHVLTRTGRFDEAVKRTEQALDLFTELGDLHGAAYTHTALAWILGSQERHQEALDQARQALAISQSLDDPGVRAEVLNAIGWRSSLTGDHGSALDYCRRALAMFRELGDLDGQANALDSLGHAHRSLGHDREAVGCYEEALGLYRNLRNPLGQAMEYVGLGDVHADAGRRQAARAAWRRALTILERLNHHSAGGVRAKLES